MAVLTWLAACGAAAAQETPQPGPTDADLLIQRVRLFDPRSGTFTEPVDLLVLDHRIAAVGDVEPTPGPVARLDAAGRYAVPGLWDSHVHLSFLTLGGDSSVLATLEAFVRAGIMNVRDVGGPLDTVAVLSRRVALGQVLGPRIHYAGPLLSPPPLDGDLESLNEFLPGWAVPVQSAEAIDSILDGLVRSGATLTKAIGPWDRSLFHRYADAAGKRSLRIALDPGAPILNTIRVDTALAVGVASIEHAQAPWSSVLRPDLDRELAAFVASDAPLAEGADFMWRVMTMGEASVDTVRLAELATTWARSSAFFCPTLAHAYDYRSDDLTERVRRAYDGRGTAAQLFVREFSAGGVRLLVGQDGVEPEGTLNEMEVLAEAGVSPVEILRGATLHPAESLGLEDRFGTLEPGRVADILILDRSPLEGIENIRSVWRVVYDGQMVER